MSTVRRWWPLLLSTLLTCAILGPLFGSSGFWLVGDMVFVPRQPWKPEWWGLGEGLARAVPMDAVVSVLTHVLPGWVVQRVALVVPLISAGVGIDRLVRRLVTDDLWARSAAIVFMIWNPWVHDRLMIGQWAILAGYAVLPWVALTAHAVRADAPTQGRSRYAPLAIALVLAALCSPSSGLMAVGVAVVLVASRAWSATVITLALGVVANLPWLVPSLVGRSAQVDADGVFAAFAPAGESGLGAVASLLSLGGTWKTAIVAPERTSAVIVVLAAMLSVVAVLGWWRQRAARTIRRLGVVGLLALAIAIVPLLPGGTHLLDRLGTTVPPLALLRDAQRYLAPAVLPLSVGLAAAVVAVRQAIVPGRWSLHGLVALLVAAPIVLLPSLAWGGLGDLRAVHYPAVWDAVAGHLDDDDLTVVLPWHGSYRGFAWNQRRAVLDPAPRYLPGQVVIDDRLYLVRDGETTIVPTESPLAGRIDQALSDSDPAAALQRLGVRWVLVEEGMPGSSFTAGRPVVDADGLRLYDLAGAVPEDLRPGTGGRRTIAVAVSDLLTAVLLLCMVCVTGVSSRRQTGRRHT